eukprot:1352122-Prymnesium_polylepis.1
MVTWVRFLGIYHDTGPVAPRAPSRAAVQPPGERGAWLTPVANFVALFGREVLALKFDRQWPHARLPQQRAHDWIVVAFSTASNRRIVVRNELRALSAPECATHELAHTGMRALICGLHTHSTRSTSTSSFWSPRVGQRSAAWTHGTRTA